MTEPHTLADRIEDALPQTQCTRCGYPDCRSYAQAIAAGEAGINQCPPGGAEGVATLARLTGRPALPLDPAHGREGPRQLAVIDEAWCIGCTLCIQACPVDAITPDAKFVEDLGADSLDTVELVMALEEAFEVDIPDEVAETIHTFRDVMAYLKSKVGTPA